MLQQMKIHMNQIQPDSDPSFNTLLRNGFINAIPTEIAQHLILQEEMPIDSIAHMADKLLEARKPTQVYQMEVKHENDDLVHMMEDMQRQTNILQRSREHSNPEITSEFCFFHRKFGSKARKCQQPCKWQAKLQAENARGAQ